MNENDGASIMLSMHLCAEPKRTDMLVAANRLLFSTQGSPWRASFVLFPLALLPSVGLTVAATRILALLGLQTVSPEEADRALSFVDVLGVTLFAPVVETLLLAGGLAALSRFSEKKWLIAGVSALIWGGAHAAFRGIWFFGTAWTFFVLSYAYLVWRSRSLREALTVACLPHTLINATVVGIDALSRYR